MYFILFVITVGFFQIDAIFQCETRLKAVGCYNDNRALPTLLINEKDKKNPVSNGNYAAYERYMLEFLCRCANKAKVMGYMFIGIKDGECWSGRKSHQTYNKYGVSSNCTTNIKNRPTCIIGTGTANTNYVYRIIDRLCESQFTPIGCFNDGQVSPRPVPNYSMNERDNTASNWDGYMIEWENWDSYLPQLICRCAQIAKDLGHDIFAIQYFGECWTGKKDDTKYDRDGKSNNCKGMKYNLCACFDYHCAGIEKVNFVYQVKVKSDIPQYVLPQQSRNDYFASPKYQNNGYFFRYRKQYLNRYDDKK